MPDRQTPAVQPGRRAVLRAGLAGAAGVAVLSTSACRLRVGSPDRAASTPGASATPSVDQLALGRAADRAAALAADYTQAAQVRPDLAAGLGRLGADHEAHVRAISAVLATAAGASPSTGPTATSTPTAPTLIAATVLSILGQDERSSTSAALADLASVAPPTARLLASIAACGAAHVALLAALPAGAGSRGTPTGGAS